MANPQNPATASTPIPPPLVNIPLVEVRGGLGFLTPSGLGVLQQMFAIIQGGGGILDLLTLIPPRQAFPEPVVQWTPVPTASTVYLTKSPSENILLTGTVTVSSFGAGQNGQAKAIKAQDQFTLTNSGTLVLPNDGQNLLVRAGDTFQAICYGGSTWVVTEFQPATVVAFGPVRFHAGSPHFSFGNATPYTDDASLSVATFDAASLRTLSIYREDVLPGTKTGVSFDYVFATNEFRVGTVLAGAFTARIGVTSGGNLLPVTTGAIDLGSTARRWKGVYANTLDLSGDATIAGAETVSGAAHFGADVTIAGTETVSGNAHFGSNVTISGDETISGNEKVLGNLSVTGSAAADALTITNTIDAGGVIHGASFKTDQTPSASATAADVALPLDCAGVTFYMKLSSTP